ncbi:type I restriction endonuclease subunit R [Desulfolithobacter sp.]
MSEANKTPEQVARDRIDLMLEQAGWSVQDKKQIDFGRAKGIAVREYPTDSGPADYVLFVDRRPIGVIEAKRPEMGQNINVVAEQTAKYATAKLKWIKDNKPLPLLYESTGEITLFRDERDPSPRSREVFWFHQPQTLDEWIAEPQTLRDRLQNMPPFSTEGLRKVQVEAITRLEESFAAGRPRALIQMATGAGKTFTAITFIYRLLKYANAKRILFLVDTKNLGEQAEQEFMAYLPNDDNRKFTELYNVQRLSSSYIADSSQVVISTIQRLYSILKGEELDEAAELENPAEHRMVRKEPLPVVYNPELPIEHFDFIVIDECHRSIYNLWQQVLDYFDAFLIGLTATPDKRTFAFFHENVVSEYTHEQAVADGVNVGYDVYTIETEITKKGAELKAKRLVPKRDKLTRKKRWDLLDDDLEYSGKQLDRDVVNPSQIRKVIRTFREKLPEIFPGRKEAPKTLIFAKNDSHADDIIRIVREEFDEGNAFCKKVTYKAEEDPKSVLAQFRNEYNPRIAVTVDMIATGTDVRPLECLLFMRDVRSRNYFEQMKGRGTRVLDYDELKKVTPSAAGRKTHFVIIDAVGVTKSVKTDSRPLERKPSVSFKDLLMSVLMGADDEETLTSLANRLARLNQQLDDKERQQIEKKAGKPLPRITRELLDAVDPDRIEEQAKKENNLPPEAEPDEEQRKQAASSLAKQATAVFNGELNDMLENIRRSHEQVIDDQNIDRLIRAEWDGDARENAQNLTREFAEFLRENRDELTALRIFFDQPYRRREVTFQMLQDVLEKLRADRPRLAPLRVWDAFAMLDEIKGKLPLNELTALVALIRRVTGIDSRLTPFSETVSRNFKNWIFRKHEGAGTKFTDEQMAWLRMIRDHIAASHHLERDDLELAPFDAHGGLGKMWQLFGEDMDRVIEDLNEVLAA